MKAVVYYTYGDIDSLQVAEINEPRPNDNEVVVKVKAISLNPVDLKKMRGGFKLITNIKKFPKIIGCDFSGEIVEIGKDVGAFKVGDNVFGMTDILFAGSAAERIKISQKSIALAPKNIDLDQSAAIPQAANTCLLALRNLASLRKGHKLLINGASGGVGTTALQIAAIYEAETTAVASFRNTDWIKNEFKTQKIIDYTKEDFANLNEEFDIIFDANGNRSFPEVEKCLTNNGIYVTTKNNIYNQIDFAKQFLQRKKSKVVLSARSTTSNLDMFRMWIEDGKLRPIIEKTFTFDEFKDAYEHLAGGRAKGKIVLKIN
tara:strand:+ start:1890 stop:2840 length:951 start_codon:yes stop_codon:yes gene_type:complete